MAEEHLPQEEQEQERRRRRRPARPLYGYLDIGAAEARHSRRAVIRAWVILAILIIVYWAVVLTVYFVEPGLR